MRPRFVDYPIEDLPLEQPSGDDGWDRLLIRQYAVYDADAEEHWNDDVKYGCPPYTYEGDRRGAGETISDWAVVKSRWDGRRAFVMPESDSFPRGLYYVHYWDGPIAFGLEWRKDLEVVIDDSDENWRRAGELMESK